MLEQQIVVTSLFKYGGYFKKREGDNNNNYYFEQTGKHQWNDWLAKYWQCSFSMQRHHWFGTAKKVKILFSVP